MKALIKSALLSAVIATVVAGPLAYYQHEKNQEIIEILEIQNRSVTKMNEGMMNIATAMYFLAGNAQVIEERMDELEKRRK